MEQPDGEPVGAGLVCHPHPLHGGTMHNKVVYHAAKGMVEAGLATLRFNFRGVGASGGRHDGGRGEQRDVEAAIRLLEEEHDDVPLFVAGFSFGASVGLRVAIEHPSVVALIGIGVPLLHASFEFLRRSRKPVLLVHGEGDEFGPVDQIRDLAAELGPLARLEIVDGAGHFFDGRTDVLRRSVVRFCARQISSRTGES